MIIPQLEKDAAELTLQMSRTEIASDYGKLNEVTESHTAVQKSIQSLYSEWESLTEQLS